MATASGLIVKKNQRTKVIIDIAIITNNGRKLYLELHKRSSNKEVVSLVSSLPLLSKVSIDYTDYADENKGRGNISKVNDCRRIV